MRVLTSIGKFVLPYKRNEYRRKGLVSKLLTLFEISVTLLISVARLLAKTGIRGKMENILKFHSCVCLLYVYFGS